MLENLGGYTTLKVGGKADVTVISETQQLSAVKNPTVIGRGSKLLVSDEGVSGRVVVMRTANFHIDGEVITADAGVTLPLLASAAASVGLSGLEWACGIPGSIGGGVIMNAGAFSGCIGNILESVMVWGHGEVAREDIETGYRSCKGLPPGVITQVKLRLKAGNKREIADKMKTCAMRRAGTQPKGASAGSSFKGQDKSAGYYLEQCGMKGLRVGGAVVSEKHANFIINDKSAKAADIRALLSIAKMKAVRYFNVKLEEEIIYLGEF